MPRYPIDTSQINCPIDNTADACVTANKAIISERLKKLYIRGRGRYGAIPHPKTALLSLLLQEREKPFESREKDELEYLRERLRNAQKDWVPSPDEIYAQKRAARPLKEIHS